MEIGKNILHAREVAGLTQTELAKKAGLTDRSIRNYEKNDNSPTVDALEKIATALKITVCQLITPCMSPSVSPSQCKMSPSMSPSQVEMSPSQQSNIQSIYNKREQEIITNLRELDEEKQELHYLRIAKDALETRLYKAEQPPKQIKNSA